MSHLQPTFYDPSKTFDDNFDNGPFLSGPQFRFLGYPIFSPFGIASGPLPTSRHVRGAFQRGFDVVCYKTQRSVVFPCNPFPNVVRVDVEGDLTLEKMQQPLVGHPIRELTANAMSITNSYGNPSRGPEFWVEDTRLAMQAQGEGQLLISSVVGTIKHGFTEEDYFRDFAHTAELAASAGVKAIELNLSCPNVASEGILCYTVDAVLKICRLTKERIGDIPLIAKIGYFTAEQQHLLERIVVETHLIIAAFSSINTMQADVVNEQGQQLLPGEGRLKSGICGSGIKWAGLDMTRRLSALRDQHHLNFEIIGVGGVTTPADFHEYRAAGADVVQAATSIMWNDNLATEIKATL